MIHTHLIGQPAAASGFSVKRYSLALAIAALSFGWGAPTMAAENEKVSTTSRATTAPERIEEMRVNGEATRNTASMRLPFTVRELPQSVSEISREMIELVATHFAAKNPRSMAVANRTLERGEKLAAWG